MIYPASTLQTDLDGSATMNLVAISGTARVTVGGQSINLSQGKSTTIAEKGDISIENAGGESFSVIQIVSG